MSNFCIVSEFNPLHKGHEYILNKARELGADTVTCLMSGNATQRGELAITDKYLRAEAAIKCGADLVLELPFPWSCGTADFFALAAVNIAEHFGDVLLFGSECGDISLLSECAKVCETQNFTDMYERYTKGGTGAGKAFGECLSNFGYKELGSNDLLGVAYIRIIERFKLSIKPMTVKRLGAEYNQEHTVDGEYQSATAMRKCIENNDIATMERYLPECMCEILKSEIDEGRITDMREADSVILGYFRLCPTSIFEGISDCDGGLSNRIVTAAKHSKTASEMFERLSTKRYTDAKLRRAVLFSLTGVKKQTMFTLPEYTTLLGANEQGRKLLARVKKEQSFKIVTKPADAPSDSVQFHLSERLDWFYGLARKNKISTDEFFRKNAYILTLTKE